MNLLMIESTIEIYLNKIDLHLYEDEVIFYFYSMLFFHAIEQNIPDGDSGYNINSIIKNYSFVENENDQVFNILTQHIQTDNPSAIQKSLWKILHDLYLDLHIEKNADRDVLAQIAVSFLYSVVNKSQRISQYMVPWELTEVISAILEPFNNKTVYNPFCGCGSFLRSLFIRGADKPSSFSGSEPNHKIADISKLLLFFYKVGPDSIQVTDALIQSKEQEKQEFDIILSHIPFGVYNDDYRYLTKISETALNEARIDCHLLSHMLSHAKNDATIVAIMLNGFMFREGNDAVLRKHIVDNNYLDAIISLPPNLFYNTRVPVNIIVIKKNRPQSPMLFIDAAKDPQIVNVSRKRSVITSFGIEKITATYKSRKEIKGFSNLVGINEITKNMYKLNIDRYVHGSADSEENKPDLLSLEQDIEALQNEIAKIEDELKLCYTNFFH